MKDYGAAGKDYAGVGKLVERCDSDGGGVG